jgi:aminoglycoside phosphotransferase family enzyme/predicted kinase
MTSDVQDEVFAFLGDPATHGGTKIKRIDTHASAVFLAGDRVLKVKRAVRFPFLDYSTLDKRKAACEAEIAVNRRFAPQLYRGVVPIVRDRAGRLALGGDGTPVEWAVEMARFDETRTFDHLAARGEIDLPLADALARVVVAANARALAPATQAWPGSLANYITQNDGELRQSPDLFAPAQVNGLTQRSWAALGGIERLLYARSTACLVRRNHGDLHLGNIVLIAGKPVIFDAIEFDENIATGDVLYDLAFLLMDLVDRGLAAQANVVLNRYLAETGRDENLDGLAALPLFLSLRAAIRAKVTAAKLVAATRDREAITTSARDYFRLALTLIAPPPPVLVAIGGHSGTGKSVLARALAPFVPPAPGAVVLRSDVARKRMFDVAETERLPPEGYRTEATARVYAALAEQARRVLGAGHSAIVDAVFGKSDEREQIEAVAKAAGVPFCGLFLTADRATRIARVEARTNDASDATAEVVRRQDSYDLGQIGWATIDAGGTPEGTLTAAQAALAAHQPHASVPIPKFANPCGEL